MVYTLVYEENLFNFCCYHNSWLSVYACARLVHVFMGLANFVITLNRRNFNGVVAKRK